MVPIDPTNLSAELGDGSGTPPRSIGSCRWMWSPVRVTLDDPGRPVTARLVIVTGDDGVPRARSVEVDAREGAHVDRRGLQIPIAEIIKAAVALTHFRGPDAAPGTVPRMGHVLQVASGFEPSAGVTPRGRTHRTPLRLAQVADEYSKIEPKDGSVHRALAGKLNVSESTARNLIRQAREEGYLEPTEPRRAGRTVTEKTRKLLRTHEMEGHP